MKATTEQQALLQQFLREVPEVALAQDYVAIGICEVIGKRVLCLRVRRPPGEPPVFLHYHPEGLTDAEMAEVTRGHGLTGVGSHDPETDRWDIQRIEPEKGTRPR